MHNKWLMYGFLGVMIIALISLAMLQYRWLGSVSDAEKLRLEENLSASTENFVADFNRVFTELGQVFRIQISSSETDIESEINDSYLNWISRSQYPGLVDSVYVVKPEDNESPKVFLFTSDPALLTEVHPDQDIQQWLTNHYSSEKDRSTIRTSANLGKQSFLPIPVQLLDMIQIENERSGKNLNVRLSIDQLDDLVLIKLDDKLLKEEVIPEIASTYFSESFDDQYQLSLVDNREPRFIYYSSGGEEAVTEPDVRQSLNKFNFSNVLVFQSEIDSFEELSLPERLDSRQSAFIGLGKNGLNDSNRVKIKGSSAHIFSESFTSITVEDSNVATRGADSLFSTSMSASLGNVPWELWLSFKEGSLDTFVNKTRNRNLGISFGILGILGIGVVIIVLFSQRSRELADQQMLFVAGVSHELRTPITVIRSAAENLSEGVVQNEERKREYAELMLKEGRRLSDMVDQIMEFSGIQSGKRIYHFKEVVLTDLLDMVKEESLHLLEEYGMQLEYSVSTKQEKIFGDHDAILLSITNLIHNAIKFSGTGEKVILKVEDVSLKGGAALRIQVQDFGNGIPEKEQKDIFKPFFRGEKSIRDQVRGNGIGLNLVQKVAIAHHGEITLKSKQGEGSTFSLVLPIRSDLG